MVAFYGEESFQIKNVFYKSVFEVVARTERIVNAHGFFS